MNCFTLNEKTYNNIKNILEKYDKQERTSEETHFKSLYSPATLINDWSDKRWLQDKSDTPAEPLISESMDQYRKPCETKYPERKEYFNMIFDSYGFGQELLLDHLGFSYYGNYVSSYDLCFNHLTKGICGPFPRQYHKGHYKPEIDLTRIYGNLTQWGLKERVYERVKSESCKESPPTSENRAEYVSHDMAEFKKINNFPSFKRKKAIY